MYEQPLPVKHSLALQAKEQARLSRVTGPGSQVHTCTATRRAAIVPARLQLYW